MSIHLNITIFYDSLSFGGLLGFGTKQFLIFWKEEAIKNLIKMQIKLRMTKIQIKKYFSQNTKQHRISFAYFSCVLITCLQDNKQLFCWRNKKKSGTFRHTDSTNGAPSSENQKRVLPHKREKESNVRVRENESKVKSQHEHLFKKYTHETSCCSDYMLFEQRVSSAIMRVDCVGNL